MAVQDSDVKALIDTNRDTAPFITTAQLIYDEFLATKGYSDERQFEIVKYLAAHFACVTEERGGLKESAQGNARETYKAPGDQQNGLQSTRFGQMSLMLDSTGTLASITANNSLKAKFAVISQDKGENGPLWWLWQ